MKAMHSPRKRALLVTSAKLPALAPDDLILVEALREIGIDSVPAVWTDDRVDWAAADAVILRSPWDYFLQPRAFRSWLARTAALSQVLNPPEIVAWNIDKIYLNDLACWGIPVVPTRFCESVDRARAPEALRGVPWDDIVIKPSVGGSAHGARRFGMSDRDAAELHLTELLGPGRAMIQPYLPEVETLRERALVFIAGRFSHAAIKAPFDAGAAAGERQERRHEAAPEEIAFAQLVLQAAGATALPYARVDIVPAESGFLLMELEVIEPALYFFLRPEAAEELAQEIAARVAARHQPPLDLEAEDAL